MFLACLARAVGQGLLPPAHARAAIAARIMRGMREGTLEGNGTLKERLHLDLHLFGMHLEAFAAAEARAAGAIRRVIHRLIALGAPSRRLLAESFDANADCGSPLTEGQVTALVKSQVHWAIQPKGRRHAG